MMEDNKIAFFLFEAGEEVHEDVDDAKRVEKCADGDAPDFHFYITLKGISEWNVKKQ